MNRPRAALRGAVSANWARLSVITSQSERSILLGTVLLASAISVTTGFVLGRYYSVDVLTSLLIFAPDDCYHDWPTRLGRHCFSDYSITLNIGMVSNPWDPYPLYLPPDFQPTHFNYTAAGMVPQMIFGHLADLLGAPRLGMFGYLLVLTAAIFVPALWAVRGARGLERVVIFVACGAAAIPAWVAIDRGNSLGFVVPIALVFLVALCRRQWGLVTIMVVLAALVKPQFVVLAAALFAAHRWRSGGVAVAGAVIANLAAYALWPRDFPRTIMQSIHNIGGYGGAGSGAALVAGSNVSFGKGLLMVPDAIAAGASGGTIPPDFLAAARSVIGYVILILVTGSLLVLGRRIPPIMAGIVLLATASLFPPLTNPYYLVFVLPVAALVVRDPDGPPGTGVFDRLSAVGGRRRAVGICVSLAIALCIAQVALPGPPLRLDVIGPAGLETRAVVATTLVFAPVLWLIACTAIIVSYARRPAAGLPADSRPAPEVAPESDAGAPEESQEIAEFSPQQPA